MKAPASAGRVGRFLSRAWYDPAPGMGPRLVLSCLAPASWAFDAAIRLRGTAYDRGWLTSDQAPLPVVSVGNLAVGGTGKTPVVIEVASRLAASGHHPAVLSRGYGASSNAARLVATRDGLCCAPEVAGDEPTLIARRCPGMVVLAGPDRAVLAHLAARDHRATVAVLDDGLQHRRLARDLDIVVVDATNPLGNGHLFPRGPLRERPSALGRANLVWVSRVDEAPSRAFGSAAEVARLLAGRSVVKSRFRPTDLLDPEGRVVAEARELAGRRVVALCGVARPASFLSTLTRLGAEIVGTHLFGDHHPFTGADLRPALDSAAREGALVVTTEKDAPRLPDGSEDVRALRVELEIVEGQDVLDAALDAVSRPV